MTSRKKLNDVTFTLNNPKPSLVKTLTWCNTVPKGKRCKPAKINGVQHHEISDSAEPTYFQSVQ